jgi:hypothetical protein
MITSLDRLIAGASCGLVPPDLEPAPWEAAV